MSADVHTRETPPRPTPKSSTPALATLPHGSGRRSHPGPLAALQALVADTGTVGGWKATANGVWDFRSGGGAVLHWSSTKGTVWVEGREPARAELEAAFDFATLGFKREEGG